MTLNWAELQQLGQAISQASDEKLIQIVRIVDTLPERTQLDDAIAKVRHRLFWLKPPRPLTLARFLFAPVEDLLDGPLRYRRGSKRFSRAIIRPVNDIVEAALGPAKATAIRTELTGKTTKDRAFALAFGERLWPPISWQISSSALASTPACGSIGSGATKTSCSRSQI
jgi:hypothetical protein